MRRTKERSRRAAAQAEAVPMDSAALTLTFWLALMTAAAALGHLVEANRGRALSVDGQAAAVSSVRPLGTAYAGY